MPLHELDPLLQQIRTVVLELRQLEGDGADGAVLARRKREVERLKSRLAELVSRDYSLAA